MLLNFQVSREKSFAYPWFLLLPLTDVSLQDQGLTQFMHRLLSPTHDDSTTCTAASEDGGGQASQD